MDIMIYTDGSCQTQTGKGGWAAILTYGSHRKTISGHADNTTNNRMELTAVIKAIEALKPQAKKTEVMLFTDSKYVVSGMANFADWKARNYFTRGGTKVANLNLWNDLINTAKARNIRIVPKHIVAHSGNALNEECDNLAKTARNLAA